MPSASNVHPVTQHDHARRREPDPGGGTRAVARDFAVLLISALAIGATAAFGMMLAVLVLA